jgi:hypothetical protein
MVSTRERYNRKDMKVIPLSDSTILCESKQTTYIGDDVGVWSDSGILTGNLRSTYLKYGEVLVTTHEKPVFVKLLQEIRDNV